MSKTPTVPGGFSGAEGQQLWTLQKRLERDPRLAKEAKRLNSEKYGVPTCEACFFSHPDLGMFDAHHPNPLAAGQRVTLVEHLEVLCPTCHRRAHRVPNPLQPLQLFKLKEWVMEGRP
jgi:5-methylcytosine-specific restriction protein A